jgi:ABC-type amino acid transport substrate-binding protein
MYARPRRPRLVLLAWLLGALATVCGCVSIPADPRGTLEHVRGGSLRVGMSAEPPWTSLDSGSRSGVEVQLVEGFAEHLDARLEWQDGGEESLIEDLHLGRLDLVVGGITSKSPWLDKAVLTRPYVVVRDSEGSEQSHVMAAPMGENAFLVELEGFLAEREALVAEQVEGERP